MRKSIRIEPDRARLSAGIIGALSLIMACLPALAADAVKSPPVKIAVFEFELDDVSAAGAASRIETDADLARMKAVTGEARRLLVQSGRYILIDTAGVDAAPVKERSLRNCNGCEVAIARQLGAEQSLIGAVTRVENSEYYALLLITDTKTGYVVDQQTAFFTGAEDAWASGVRMLLRHGVLASGS